MSKKWWAMLGLAAVLAVVGFLLFRPDTLFTEVRADESLAEAFVSSETTSPPATSVDETSSTIDSEPADAGTSDGATSTTAADQPQAFSQGRFVGIDHRADGTATIYEQDGRFVLRLEDDTDIQNGPDLYVWLIPEATYEGEDPQSFVDLGTLKGTVGGQNYELPSDFDPDGPWTVLIWCLRFSVPFAAAELG